MPRGINGEYYNYRMPFGGDYPNPLISLYNTIMHSADDRNPHLITGIAPSGSINKLLIFLNLLIAVLQKLVLKILDLILSS